MTTAPPRPPKVLSACLFVGASSALLLFYVIGWLTSWSSQDVQQGLTDAIPRADVEAAGLTVQGVIDVLRIALMVLVVPLIGGVVFAVYAARGHLQSRVMLTVVAGVVALVFIATGGLIGLLPAAFAVVAVMQLWNREARVWFAAANGLAPPVAPAAPADVQPQAAPDPFAGGPPPAAVSAAPSGPPVASRPGPPSTVRTITLVASIASGLAAAGSLIYLAVYLLARDALIQAQLDSPLRSMSGSSETEIVDSARLAAALCATTLALSVVALGATWLLWKRQGAGHFVLTVLSGVTVLMGVFTLVGLPWAGAAGWVFVLLRRAESRAWVAPSRG